MGVSFFLDVSPPIHDGEGEGDGRWGEHLTWDLRTRGWLEQSGGWTEERSQAVNVGHSWPGGPGEGAGD